MREEQSIRISNEEFSRWHFVGPVDERSRPDHVAILGSVYEYRTEQSDYALRLLDKPNCSHRQVTYFNDPELDTWPEFFEKEKQKVVLRHDDDKEKWVFDKEHP